MTTTDAQAHAAWDWRGAFCDTTASAPSKRTVSLPRFRIRADDIADDFDTWFAAPLDDECKVQLLKSAEAINRHDLLPAQSPQSPLHQSRYWVVKYVQRILRKLLPRERQFIMERLSWPVLSLICDDPVLQPLLHRATLARIIDRHEWAGWAAVVNFVRLRVKEATPFASPTTDPVGVALRPANDEVLINLSGMVDGDWNFVGAQAMRRFHRDLAHTSPRLDEFVRLLEEAARDHELQVVYGPAVVQTHCSRRCTGATATAAPSVIDIYLVGAIPAGRSVSWKWPVHSSTSLQTHTRSLYACDTNAPSRVLVVHLDVYESVPELVLSRKLDLCCVSNGDTASIYSSLYFAVHRKQRECSDIAVLSKERDRLVAILPQGSSDHGHYLVALHHKNLDHGRVDRSLSRCYHCHCRYRNYKQDRILHYAEFCMPCALFNREQRLAPLQWYSDNQNRHIALVTGGRIKIGFATCLKLLRSGARVIATTRFPMNALYRYRQEHDFDSFRDRLEIYALDMRNLASLEAFIRFLYQHLPYLSIFINNAAQTFTYDDTYFQLMHQYEQQQRQLRVGVEAESDDPTMQQMVVASSGSATTATCPSSLVVLQPAQQQLQTQVWQNCVATINEHDASCNRMTLWEFKTDQFGELITAGGEFWNQRAHQVDAMRIVESNVVNLIAPSLLVSQLRELMTRCTETDIRRKYIVMVTCREGTFDMRQKAYTHFHTNTCKAGLNMITRTVASDLKGDCLFINSVDPGFVSSACNTNKLCPIDCTDAASRILTPIRLGEQAVRDEAVVHGRLWRHYRVLDAW